MSIFHSDMPSPSKEGIKFLAELVDYYHGCAANAQKESDEYADISFDDGRILNCLTVRIVYLKL